MTKPVTHPRSSPSPECETSNGSAAGNTSYEGLGGKTHKEKGGIGYVLLWFLGIPIPILIIFALLRGCA